MKILKEFSSRKNKVRLVDRNGEELIEKVYKDRAIAEQAMRAYRAIISTSICPKVCAYTDKTITMQYIKGVTLLDIFLKGDEDDIDRIVSLLIRCVDRLYNEGYLQTDNNFTNYIFTDDDICYSIDLDEMIESGCYTYEDCIADIILFALTYDNVGTDYKVKFCSALLNKTNISRDTLRQHLIKAKERYHLRRNKAFDEDEALSRALES